MPDWQVRSRRPYPGRADRQGAWYMTATCVLSLAVAVFAYPRNAKA